MESTIIYSASRTLTFEDSDYTADANYIGYSSWSSLIDNAQYGGALLYGENGYGVAKAYNWADTYNTYLTHEIIDNWGMGTYEFWNGGIAISNFYAETKSGMGYESQLAVPYKSSLTGGSGNNGSANFAVVNADIFSQTSISFAYGLNLTIDNLYIANTAYALSTCLYGDGYISEPLGSGDDFWVTITGYKYDGTKVGEVVYYLVKNGVAVEGWNRCDLSSLGSVNKINFKIDSSVQNAYGSVVPSYIAIDDITVLF